MCVVTVLASVFHQSVKLVDNQLTYFAMKCNRWRWEREMYHNAIFFTNRKWKWLPQTLSLTLPKKRHRSQNERQMDRKAWILNSQSGFFRKKLRFYRKTSAFKIIEKSSKQYSLQLLPLNNLWAVSSLLIIPYNKLLWLNYSAIPLGHLCDCAVGRYFFYGESRKGPKNGKKYKNVE